MAETYIIELLLLGYIFYKRNARKTQKTYGSFYGVKIVYFSFVFLKLCRKMS